MPSNSSGPQTSHHLESLEKSEISLLDMLLFLKRAHKTVAFSTLAGIVIAFVFLFVTPNQFEAIANITMGKVAPSGANIEDPQSLINRMSLPSSIDSATLQVCGLLATGEASSAGNSQASAAQFSRVIKLSIPKGVANVVELKVTRSRPEVAKACANSVFEYISASQKKMMDSILHATIVANSARIKVIEGRLAQNRNLLAKASEDKNSMLPFYFALLSEIRNLEDERDKLLTTINASDTPMVVLQSPVYVADEPIYPKKALSLIVGLFSGFILGVMIALVREILDQLKT